MTCQGRTCTVKNPLTTLGSSSVASRAAWGSRSRPGSRKPARRERVQVPRPHAPVLDEPGVAQHPQMLAHCGPADGKPVGQFPGRRGAAGEQFQDAAPHRLPERVECFFGKLVTHQQPLQ